MTPQELAVLEWQTTPQVVEMSSRAHLALQSVQALEITGPAMAAQADTMLSRTAQHLKQAEDLRVFLVKPLNDHVKRINEGFAKLIAPLKEADRIVRDKILMWKRHLQREQARRNVEAAALQSTAAVTCSAACRIWTGSAVRAAAFEQAQTAVNDPVAGATIRRDWEFEVVTLADVPTQYLLTQVDAKRVKVAMAQGILDMCVECRRPRWPGGSPVCSLEHQIPGLRIFEKETLVRRPNSA